jgi:hypothetical protein
MRDCGLIHLLLLKLRELSFEVRTISIPPSDKAIKLADYSANQIANCFTQLIEEGLLQAGSQVDNVVILSSLSEYEGPRFCGGPPQSGSH